LRALTTAGSFHTSGRNLPRLLNSSIVWRVTACFCSFFVCFRVCFGCGAGFNGCGG
jgi:hypothetical protein